MKQELSLPELIAAIWATRWGIGIFTLGLVTVAVVYIAVTPNVYRADALIQLETERDRLSVNEGSLSQVAAEFDSQPTTMAELSIIKSRTVLGDVVDELSLEISARPKYPFKESFLRTSLRNSVDLSNHALVVERFEVPVDRIGEPFVLVVGEQASYTVFNEDGELIAEGAVGKALEAPGDNGPLQLFVASMNAPPGSQFELIRKSRDQAIEELGQALSAREERAESGLIRVSFEGEDRDRIARIVDAVANAYLKRQNAWRIAAIEEKLAYLDTQAPILKTQTQQAERALGTFRRNNGSVNLSSEAERLLDRSVQLQVQIAEKIRERDNYLSSHPQAFAINLEIIALQRELKEVEDKISEIPRLQQKFLNLSRSADINAALYANVLKHIQELQLIKSASSRQYRLVDPGKASVDPVKPRKAMLLTVAVAFGLFFGSIGAVARRFWRGTVNGPDGVEELLGVPVYASLPRAFQSQLLTAPGRQRGTPQILIPPNGARHRNGRFLGLPTFYQPDQSHIAAEGFRSLRSWLTTSSFKRTSNVLLITGPSQGIGKTFVSTNLAATLAKSGSRVLLIDGDLRKGNVHDYFGTKSSPGLSDVIAGDLDLSQAIHEVIPNRLDVLPTGSQELRLPELLFHEKFAPTLALASQYYDEVIIDSPPILSVSDASVIGQHVGGALLVVHEDLNTTSELLETRKRLEHAGVPLRGVVYNGYKGRHSRYAYYAGDSIDIVQS